MNRLQNFLKSKRKLICDGDIKTSYMDYKRFVCCPELPQFDIRYVDSISDKSIDYKANVYLFGEKIILNININSLSDKNFKPTLVHEFTHIYDFHMLLKSCTKDFLEDNLRLYSEYHASQIEILYSYHVVSDIFSDIDLIAINPSKLTEIPNKKVSTYKEKVTEYMLSKTTKSFNQMKVAYMYLCGALYLLAQILDKQPNPPSAPREYKEIMQEIAIELSKTQYNEIPSKDVIKKIGSLNKKTEQIFLQQ